MLLLPVFAPFEKDWISGQALRSDVETLRRTYGALHPGLYRYSSPAQVDARFSVLKRRLERGARLREAFLAFSEFAASVKCGHTFANPVNQSDWIAERLFSGRTRLPFHFVWIGERMVVTRDLTGRSELKPGTEVVRLDGRPAREVLRRLMRYARADGGNDAKRRSTLGVQGYGRFETFDVFYPLAFPPSAEQTELTIRRPDASGTVAVSVELLTADEQKARRAAASTSPKAGDGAETPWTFRRTQAGDGLLTMPTWALYDSNFDWKGFLRGAMTELAQTPGAGLIVDVRGNEGGIDVGNEILRYVVTKPLALSEFERYTRYETVPTALRPNLSTWDRSFFDWRPDVRPAAFNRFGHATFHRMTRFDDGASSSAIEPLEPRLSGKLVVLMDAENSSATFQFAQQVQQNRLGTLVGQPSGGNRRGINGGAFFFFTLPNSGIEIDLPLIAFLPSTPQPDRGIVPDVPVSVTPESIAGGRDLTTEAAERVLKSARG